MKLLLEGLGQTPIRESFCTDAAWRKRHLHGLAQNAAAECPVQQLRLEFSAHRIGADVYLQGAVRGESVQRCGRCLLRYAAPLHEAFRLVLSPAGQRPPAEPEAARMLRRYGFCTGADLDTGWFRGAEIHLDPLAAELAALAMPLQPRCQPNCRGLCPQCGANRNNQNCNCRAEQKPPSPFAALAKLRAAKTAPEESP